jgi:methylated-DNA-[protein]-cysteine S-methyltransferase
MIRVMKPPVAYQAQLRTPFSVLGIHCVEDALTGITFLPVSSAEMAPQDAFAREVCGQLQAYVFNEKFKFNLPLKLEGTAHQRKVWQAMCDIPCGEIKTYGALATIINSSPRAVGQACGSNPIPIVVPCHRVVSKAGLGGFMHRADDGALNIKRWLLSHEQR